MANAKNPMEIMETVFIPKESGEEPQKFVSLNGRTWLIPRGKQVEVPRPVAAIIRASQMTRDAADEFREAEQAKMKVIQGAP